jgi:hypothetical protein
MSRSSAHQWKGDYAIFTDPEFIEVTTPSPQNTTDAALSDFEQPESKSSRETLSNLILHAIPPPEEPAFKTFLKRHFRKETPPFDLKDSILQQIQELER